MLQSLRIRNLALLEEVSLDFEAGFSVVTGETGAGKSVLLGALSLLAGERAEKSVIRQGAALCEVEASLYFEDPSPIDRVLSSLELPACEDGILILKRNLSREKAPKITVNGGFAPLSALQRLGEHWIDFHGPSEPRRLLKDACQLELLDLFGRNAKLSAEYSSCYAQWRRQLAERERLTQETKLSASQISYLESQLEKLELLELNRDAIEALERDFSRMTKAQEILESSSTIAAGLIGEDSLSARISALLREARHLESLDAASKSLADRLGSTVVEIADLGAEFETLSQECQFDPEQAESLRSRMEAWLEAKRRFGADPEAIRAAMEEMRSRLLIQGDIEGACARLDRDISISLNSVRLSAEKLRTQREKAARELAKNASSSIAQLGFRKTEFLVKLHSLTDFSPSGDCRCEFLFSPNVGEPPLPLSSIASSGELARVMLALKSVLADIDQVPVLVFDEVDANVGGEIGRVVGEKMSKIAARHQVLCVTHLPQVAAYGSSHFLVEKDQSGERAEVRIKPLHTQLKARVSELARMLGDRNAKSALTHAEEMLAAVK